MGLAVVMIAVVVAVQASGTSSEAPLGLLDLLDSLSLVMAGGGFSRGVYRLELQTKVHTWVLNHGEGPYQGLLSHLRHHQDMVTRQEIGLPMHLS